MGHLSDARRRRIAAVVVMAGIVVAVLAIANLGPFSNPDSEAQRAQATVEGFFAAAHARDFKSACAELTVEEQHAVEQRAASLATQRGLEGCDQILTAFLGDELAGTQITQVVDVRVSGNQAVVDATMRSQGDKGTRSTTFHLFLVGGEWRIADFGV
jgi:hypothetical protein